MADLEDELQAMFPAAQDIGPRPKYSTSLKTAIVREQLNIRKWVYGRKFREGFLDSSTTDGNPEKLAKLKAALATILKEEEKTPPVRKPPKIRSEYEVGPNTTRFRLSLDAERNEVTKRMETQFLRDHPGMVFPGHKCLYDYGKGKPENTEAILQQKVQKIFDDPEKDEPTLYCGTIVSYEHQKRWWRIEYEDGDSEQLNFRELCKLQKPPDFSDFRYSADGTLHTLPHTDPCMFAHNRACL